MKNMVKKLMRIVGAELIATDENKDVGGIMKITMLPHSNVKIKKPGLMELATGGLDTLMKQIQPIEQQKVIHYITMNEWLREFNNEIFSYVWLDLTLEKLATTIVKEKR